jgi:serine protease AprX
LRLHLANPIFRGVVLIQVSRKAIWGSAIAFLLLTPAFSFAEHVDKHPKVDALLSASSSEGSRRVIITTRSAALGTMRKRLQSQGHQILGDHSAFHALTTTLTPREIAAYADDPDVDAISADTDVGVFASKSGSTSTTDYSSVVSDLKTSLGLGNWFTGSSVTVALIDSGLAPDSDFSGRIVGFYDFTGGSAGIPATAFDDYGHGTHVAGLIGASGVESLNKYAGVAPGVKYLALKVLNKNGVGKTSDVLNALQFAIANKNVFNIGVINLSLGHPIYESAATDPLVQAVEQAVRAGITVVVAAGNYGTNPNTGLTGYGGTASPGNAPSAITVGAANTFGTVSRQDDRVASFSSRGPSWFDGFAKPDILAPGYALVADESDGSTLATDYPSLIIQSGSNKFMKLSGSSMATGVVSGLVAVMLEAQQYGAYSRYQATRTKNSVYIAPPALTPNALKAMLQYSATPLHDEAGVTYDALTQGAGLVNGVGAIALAYYTDTTKSIGAFWLTTMVPPSTQFDATLEPWAQKLIWGSVTLTGTSLIDINQAAWNTAIMWGAGDLDNIVWGTADNDNIIWGSSIQTADVVWAGNVDLDNIVWGTSLLWEDNIVWGTGLVGFFDGDNIIWGADDGDNIIWGASEDDNIIWGSLADDNIIWGTSQKVTVLSGGGL